MSEEVEESFAEKLDREVYNISQGLISYSDEYYPMGSNFCPELDRSMANGRLRVDYYHLLEYSWLFRLFSLFKILIEHIQCKYLLGVIFEANKEDYYYEKTFILDPLPIEEDIAHTRGYLVPFEETDMVTILTAKREVTKRTYFSFVYLFEYTVWICTFLSLLSLGFLISKSSRSKITLNTALTDIYRLLTGQTSNSARLLQRLRNGRWKRVSSYFILQMLFYISFLTSTIVTKAMSSLLLETYMSNQKMPIINSLEDIANNPGLEVQGEEMLLILEDETEPELWERISTRVVNVDKSDIGEATRAVRSMNDFQTLQAILDGKLVLLDNSKNNREKIRMFPSLPLVIGNQRYKRTLFTFYINKDATQALNISKLVQNAIEAGFHIHLRIVKTIRDNIKGRIMRNWMGKDKFDSLLTLSDDTKEFTVKMNDLTHGILLFLVIGFIIALIVLLIELGINYYKYIYPSIDGFNMNSLGDYKLAGAVKLESLSEEKFVLKFVRLNNSKQKKIIHKKLLDNYKIYFT